MNFVHFKKIVILLLCITTLFLTVFVPTDILPVTNASAAVNTDEYQQLINQLEQEKKELEAEIADLNASKAEQNKIKTALQRKIDNLQNQINISSKQLNNLSDSVKQLETEIANKEKNLEENKFLFKKRLNAIYKSGGTTASTLGILLSADDLGDLLSKSELTRALSAYDKALMEKITNDVSAIETKKSEVNELLKQQKEVKSVLDGKKAELKSEIKSVNSVISGFNSDIKDIQSDIKDIEKAQAEYEQAIKDALGVGKDQIHSGQFLWPVAGYHYVSSPFGWRIHPIYGTRKHHNGVDISGSNIKGKPILASADGIVSIAKYNSGGYGYYVMVNHGRGSDGQLYYTLYAHMTKYIVSRGQSVKKGQIIGYVGSTGASTGPHLHYEIRVGSDDKANCKNPMNYF